MNQQDEANTNLEGSVVSVRGSVVDVSFPGRPLIR